MKKLLCDERKSAGQLVLILAALFAVPSTGLSQPAPCVCPPGAPIPWPPSATPFPYATFPRAEPRFVPRGLEHPGVPALSRLPGTRQDALRQAWSNLQTAFEGDRHPVSPDLLYERVVFFLALPDRDQAARDLTRAVRTEVSLPGRDAVDSAKTLVKVRDLFNRLTRLTAGREYAGEAETCLSLGITAMEYGDPATAVRWLTDAVQLQPGEPLNWYYRAVAYRRSGDDTSAARDARVGAYLESRLSMGRLSAARGLTAVQGPVRHWLDQIRFADPAAQLAGLESEVQRSRRYQELDADAAALVVGKEPGNTGADADLPEEIRLLPAGQKQDWRRLAAAIKESPGEADLYSGRSALWAAAHNYEQSLLDAMRAFDLARAERGGTFPPRYTVNDPLVKTLESLDKMPRPPHRASAVEYYSRALGAFDAGQMRRAQVMFSDAIHRNPFEPMYWYYRAVTHAWLNESARAIEDARIGALLERQSSTGYPDRYAGELSRVQGQLRTWLDSIRKGY